MLPRRAFLGLMTGPALLASQPAEPLAGDTGGPPQRVEAPSAGAVDPQIQRLRSLPIDQDVEPVLVCIARRD
jgi:hypothetical protein